MRLGLVIIFCCASWSVLAQTNPQRQQSSEPRSDIPSKAPGKSLPGWLINVHPATVDGRGDSVATFSSDKSQINFGMHTGFIAGNNAYVYEGQAYFRVVEPGRYVFIATVEPLNFRDDLNNAQQFNCEVSFKIDGKQLFSGKTNLDFHHTAKRNQDGEVTMPIVFSGGQDLQEGDTPVNFEIGCFIDRASRSTNFYPTTWVKWQKNKITILVKTPDDATARPFRNAELFHFVKRSNR